MFKSSMDPPRIPETLWRALAEFRYAIRRFLDFSVRATRREGLLPQQHQLLLVLRAADQPEEATVGYLASRLVIRHHSAVGLVDRMARRGLVRRGRHPADRRRVIVQLTPRGEATLLRLTRALLQEYRTEGPVLVRALERVVRGARRRERPRAPRAARPGRKSRKRS